MLTHSDILTLDKPSVTHNIPPTLKTEHITLRLAETPEEIASAQRLRYKTFYQEFNITPPPHVLESGRDSDEYDPYAEHLIVIDESIKNPDEKIVGTYRLFRRENMPDDMPFFSSHEFDISKLLINGGKVLELGRSCVLPEYRSKFVLQKLWQGISDYLVEHDIDLMFGVASFHEEMPENIIEELAYLHYFHPCPDNLQAVAILNCAAYLEFPAKENLDDKKIFAKLPALIKGYLRAGAYIGSGVFKDTHLGHLDVCIIFPTKNMTPRYAKHYAKKNK